MTTLLKVIIDLCPKSYTKTGTEKHGIDTAVYARVRVFESMYSSRQSRLLNFTVIWSVQTKAPIIIIRP